MIALLYIILAAWIIWITRLLYLSYKADKRDNAFNYDGEE